MSLNADPQTSLQADEISTLTYQSVISSRVTFDTLVQASQQCQALLPKRIEKLMHFPLPSVSQNRITAFSVDKTATVVAARTVTISSDATSDDMEHPLSLTLQNIIENTIRTHLFNCTSDDATHGKLIAINSSDSDTRSTTRGHLALRVSKPDMRSAVERKRLVTESAAELLPSATMPAEAENIQPFDMRSNATDVQTAFTQEEKWQSSASTSEVCAATDEVMGLPRESAIYTKLLQSENHRTCVLAGMVAKSNDVHESPLNVTNKSFNHPAEITDSAFVSRGHSHETNSNNRTRNISRNRVEALAEGIELENRGMKKQNLGNPREAKEACVPCHIPVFDCQVCVSSFRTEKLLLAHIKRYHMENGHSIPKLPCMMCNKYFKTFRDLRNHARTHYEVKKNPAVHHLCDICNVSFSTKHSLLAHRLEYHMTNQVSNVEFPCVTCDNLFKTFKDLQDHIVQHKHDLAWFCFVCKRRFLQESRLRMHHCPASGDLSNTLPPFVCAKCSKVFYGTNTYTHHVQYCVFSEYCAMCAKEFGSLLALLNHSKECTKAEPACISCKHITDSVAVDNRHENVNILLQRVHCRCCGKCFSEISALFIEHEAACGVDNRYEDLSSSTVFWPATNNALWEARCRLCVEYKWTAQPLNMSGENTNLMDRVHCMFCGKCFTKMSSDFILHEKVCAWIEKCILHDTHVSNSAIELRPHTNLFKLVSEYLQCKTCDEHFKENFKDYFFHVASCNFQGRHNALRDTSPVQLPLPQHCDNLLGTNQISEIKQLATSTDEPFFNNHVCEEVSRLKTNHSDKSVHIDSSCHNIIEKLYRCFKCGHSFITAQFATHPCDSILKFMASCYVVIEPMNSMETKFDTTLNSVEWEKPPLEGASHKKSKDFITSVVLSAPVTISSDSDKSLPLGNTRDDISVAQISTSKECAGATLVRESLPFVSEICKDMVNYTSTIPVGVEQWTQNSPQEFELDPGIKSETCPDVWKLHSSGVSTIARMGNTSNEELVAKEALEILTINKDQSSALITSKRLSQFAVCIPEIVPTHFCQVCEKSFDSEKLYTWHLRTHDEYRPFPCSYCGCRFKRLNNLHEHVRFYHLRGQVPCYQCGKRFANSSLYRKHNKIHTRHFNFKNRKVDPLLTGIEVKKWKKKTEKLTSAPVAHNGGNLNSSPTPMDVTEADISLAEQPPSPAVVLPSEYNNSMSVTQSISPVHQKEEELIQAGKPLAEITEEEVSFSQLNKAASDNMNPMTSGNDYSSPVYVLSSSEAKSVRSKSLSAEEKITFLEQQEKTLIEHEEKAFAAGIAVALARSIQQVPDEEVARVPLREDLALTQTKEETITLTPLQNASTLMGTSGCINPGSFLVVLHLEDEAMPPTARRITLNRGQEARRIPIYKQPVVVQEVESRYSIATALGIEASMKKKRSRLIVDHCTYRSNKEMQRQLSDTTDTVTVLHLAPHTKKLMKQKTTSSITTVFALPGRSIKSKVLQKINLTVRNIVSVKNYQMDYSAWEHVHRTYTCMSVK